MTDPPLETNPGESQVVTDGDSEKPGRRRSFVPRTFDGLRFAPFRRYMGAIVWWNAALSMQLLVAATSPTSFTDSFAS